MKLLPARRVVFGLVLTAALVIVSAFQPAANKRYTLRKVVIDAGHGGHDTGCLGSNTKEKDVALGVSLKLGKLIEENFPDVKVIYTRKTDVFVELHERAEIANNAKADLFICIHCNSACSFNKKTHKVKCNEETYGEETWVMGLHKTEANLEVAKRENEVVLMEKDYQKKYDGFDPNSPEANIIFSLYQNTYLDQSLRLATLVEDELKKNGRNVRGVKQAGFLVLYKTFMPGIYIETGFLTNKTEEKFLASSQGQQTMANSIFNAFHNYKNFVETGESKTEKEVVKEKAPDTVQQIKKKETPPMDTVVVKEDSAKSVGNRNPVLVDSTTLYHPKVEKLKKDSVEIVKKVNPVKAGYYYSIQIVLSPKKLGINASVLKGVKDANEEFIDGVYKYTVGKYSSFEEAVAMQKKMRAHDFKDAFIVAYKDGNRIPVKEAKQTSE